MPASQKREIAAAPIGKQTREPVAPLCGNI
jgi:hypothetical protein